MTQAIFLPYDLTTSHPGILVLPSEIIGLILSIIDLDTIKSVSSMMLVSKELEVLTKSSIKYIKRLTVVRNSRILLLFSGIERLTIFESEHLHVELDKFNPNIWKNLEYLSIRSTTYSEKYGILLNSLGNLNISELCLESVWFHQNYVLDIPSLRKLKLICMTLDMSLIQKLNISELEFVDVCYWAPHVLNIPPLRKLILDGLMYDDCLTDKLLDIPNLESLILRNLELDEELHNPSLRKLEIINVKYFHTKELPNLEILTLDNPLLINTIPRMKSLTTINMIIRTKSEEEVFINSSTFPSLRYINIFGSDEWNPIYTGDLDILYSYDPKIPQYLQEFN